MNIPIYLYFNFVAIVVWLFVRFRFKEPMLNKIGILICASFFIELIALLYSYTFKTSNHWIYNIYTTLQIAYLAIIYS